MNERKYELKTRTYAASFLIIAVLLSAFGCQQRAVQNTTNNLPKSLRDVPSLRLNFRFETDVPAPTINAPLQSDERNPAVQSDFDQNRPQEILDKTITSPDKLRVLAVYHRAGDAQTDFRIDMYAPEGNLVRKISYDGMAIRFPDTIIWAPDSSAVAFVALIRSTQTVPTPTAGNQPNAEANTSVDPNVSTNANANADSNANVENQNSETNANVAAPTPVTEAPKAVLTFRTEQLYISNRDGADVKPLTQNEGLIYFYFVWSPDSSALAAMAATFQEWNYLQYAAEQKGERFNPQGRPRLVEKTGRERRLDDNLTNVRPVFSPDSAKVAVAFDKQVRIYDAVGDQPTQAAIPLRNQLLISSKAYDDNVRQQEQTAANLAGAPANTVPANQDQGTATLPDEGSLVSFNPIISLEWTEDSLLYLQTGFIKEMKNETESARSYLRWHRLIFSPQAVALGN